MYQNSKVLTKRKKLCPGSLFPAFHDPVNNRIKILFERVLALFCIIPAPVGITLDEPDRTRRPKVFHQYIKTLYPDLIERFYTAGHLTIPLRFRRDPLECILKIEIQRDGLTRRSDGLFKGEFLVEIDSTVL